jgi:hypothetical protein
MLLIEKAEPANVDIRLLPTRRIVAGNNNLELLDEKLVYQNGCYKRVQRWYRGIHPGLGLVIKGLTGWETLVEQDIITPKIQHDCTHCGRNDSGNSSDSCCNND